MKQGMGYAAKRRPGFVDKLGQRRHKPDYWLPLLCLLLLVIGLIIIYAISPGLAAQKNVGDNYYVSKQIIAIILGIAAFIGVANVPLLVWRRLQKHLAIAAAIASVAVRVMGERVNGAYRWIQIGGFSFQAAELIKFALLIWVACFLVDRIKNNETADFDKTMKPLLIVLAVIAFMVGKVQSDFGSTAVMTSMLVTMAFVAGLPIKKIAMVAGVMFIGAVLLVSSTAYRRQRIATFVNPERDCQNAGYQACQALIAVGSGGVSGLGLAHSVQAYGYLPEAANDSIFAILAEGFGFLGVTVVIGIFVAFFMRLGKIVDHAPDDFGRLIVAGILAWLSTQAIINVGAMVGLLPLKGITLPFISYGGTSLVFVTAAIGLAFNISRYTTFSSLEQNLGTEGNKYENTVNRRGNRRPHNTTVSRRPGA
jgi:cell division protein FtsW